MSNWFFNFVIGLVVPPFLAASTVGTFFFFAGFAFLAGTWTYFCVPETKDRSLEQLDQLFHDKAGSTDNERRQRISERLAAEICAHVDSDKSELSGQTHTVLPQAKSVSEVDDMSEK